MELSVLDRITIGNILPQKGDYISLVLKQAILEKIKITPKEIEEYELKSDGDNIKWNASKAKDVAFVLEESEKSFIKKTLQDLDTKKELAENMVGLYKKFI